MSRRVLRVNELLRQELSLLLQHSVRDPRLGPLVSITSVSVSSDLKQARVYLSAMGSEVEKKETFKALRAAVPFLRKSLAPRISLRYVPELSFFRDDSLETGARLLELLDRVKAPDKNDCAPKQP